MRKKRVVIHSDHCKAFTGFGKHVKNLLKYLYKTDKYEVIEFSNGSFKDQPDLKKMPWQAIGTLPNHHYLHQIQNDPNLSRAASYGQITLDELIKEVKPDVYISVQDPWGLGNFWDKDWGKKLTGIVHTTIDSLPLLPDAVKIAEKVKHYYVWSSFAEKAMVQIGHDHVKTIHGIVESDNFYRLENIERQELRKKFNLPNDAFIIGFVFRNQLRKSVPNLIQGFKQFLQENPNSNAYLLLHTNFSEGWNIPRLIEEHWSPEKLPNENKEEYEKRAKEEISKIAPRILATYYCKKCKQYEVKAFHGQDVDCRFCGGEKTQSTTSIKDGVSEVQLNEVYNLMDVYLHPMTSGGMEIPVAEAKMTELITCVTNYSCGEDWVDGETGGLPLDWQEYREPGTQFIKSTTLPSSICRQIKKVWSMSPQKRREMGKRAREYVLNNYSTEIVGSQFEKIIDESPFADWSDFSFEYVEKRVDYPFKTDIIDDVEFVKDLYKNILNLEVADDDEGLLHWVNVLKNAK